MNKITILFTILLLNSYLISHVTANSWEVKTPIYSDYGVCYQTIYYRSTTTQNKRKSILSAYSNAYDTKTECTCYKRGKNPRALCALPCLEKSEDIENVDNVIYCYYTSDYIDENVKPFDECPELQCNCHIGEDRLCRL